MKFIDPHPVTCPNCQETHDYVLNNLLNLIAVCKSCGYNLSSIGQEMNDRLDDWSLFVMRIELIIELEKNLNVHYIDEEVEQLVTIEDVITLTASKASGRYDREQIKQQVYEAIAEVGEYIPSQLDSKMSLINALCRTPQNGMD